MPPITSIEAERNSSQEDMAISSEKKANFVAVEYKVLFGEVW